MKRFNAFQLKFFMAMLMVLDHLDHIPEFLPPWWMEIFHVITRCVAPFFGYMAVEGFIHTRSRLKYNGRLFLWAGIMFAGNFGLNRLLNVDSLTVYNNIFFTLAMGVLALNVWCYPVKSEKISPKVILALRILIAFPITVYACVAYEGSYSVVPFMLICYFLRNKVNIRNIAICVLSVLLFIPSFVIYPSMEETIKMLMFNSDWLVFTAIPFMYLYNGERGPKTKFSKYFFYVFYPTHLWILALIGYITTII